MLFIHYSPCYGAGMRELEKEKIVAAAIGRFSHYGVRKTTMAEIAGDCGMSVGNLYRFYKNKEDIAVQGARSCMTDKAELSEQAAAHAESAMQRLRAYCLARLRYLHRLVSETPHMFEMVELITGKHQNVLQHFEDRAVEAMREIIVEGIREGELRSCDAASVAADIYNATYKYNMPLCMSAPLPQLEAELDSLIGLLANGLLTNGLLAGKQ